MLILQNESVLACLSAGFGTFALSFIAVSYTHLTLPTIA